MRLKNKKTGEIMEFDAILPEKDVAGDSVAHLEYNSLAELNAEWEDYEEPKEHCYINVFGEVQSRKPEEDIIPVDTRLIDKLKEIGNYFDTREEAEKAVEKLKAWKRLKDKGFRLDATVGDTLFCLDIFIRDDAYEPLKDDLKIVFGGEE